MQLSSYVNKFLQGMNRLGKPKCMFVYTKFFQEFMFVFVPIRMGFQNQP